MYIPARGGQTWRSSSLCWWGCAWWRPTPTRSELSWRREARPEQYTPLQMMSILAAWRIRDPSTAKFVSQIRIGDSIFGPEYQVFGIGLYKKRREKNSRKSNTGNIGNYRPFIKFCFWLNSTPSSRYRVPVPIGIFYVFFCLCFYFDVLVSGGRKGRIKVSKQCWGSKYIVIGSGSRILAQFGSESGSTVIVIQSI